MAPAFARAVGVHGLPRPVIARARGQHAGEDLEAEQEAVERRVAAVDDTADGHWRDESPSSSQRVAMRSMMNPKITADVENGKKKARSEEAELLGRPLELGHEGHAGEAGDDLVGKN
jgi:hypothetical protein